MATDTNRDPTSIGSVAAVFDLLDPPLWLVTASCGLERGGLIATFATRGSIVDTMPRIVLGVAKQHHTWRLIEKSGRFAMHLLRPDQEDLVLRFGSRSGYEVDKFFGLSVARTPGGRPLIAHSLAWLDCRVEDRMDTGDRTLYLAAVEAGLANTESTPLTVHRLFRDLPPEDVQRLDDLFARDARTDAAAISRWRAAAGSPPRP